MITPYVTIEGRKEFERNKTGFGYMVYDIAKAVGQREQVDVLCTDSRGNAFIKESVNYIGRSLWLFFKHINSICTFKIVAGLIKRYKMSFGATIRLWYYWLMSGYVTHVIKNGGYDVVHIHGCLFCDELWIDICKRGNTRFLITLHGLDSYSDTVSLEKAGKRYERDFLRRVVDGEIPITVISTGMKRLIEKTYCVKDCNSITVVCNSFSFNDNGSVHPLVENIDYGNDSNIVLCVGNIGRRKNQEQLIRAFELLPEELAQKTYILFLGGNQEEDYTIDIMAENSLWRTHYIACGVVPKEKVACYYERCNAVALMSLSEGFGLSLIEGMHFGKPSMSFSDIDAFEDI